MLLLHVSDIHFKETEVGQPRQPESRLRSDLIEDVKKMRAQIGRPVDGILLSGDTAFAGKAIEYDFAYKWLEEVLCPAAGCSIEEVFVIPGNHDVDRTAEIGPAQRAARTALREISPAAADAEVRKWLRDRWSSSVIFGPIENYNRFAAKFICALRPYLADDEKAGTAEKDLPARPFACRDLTLNDGSKLRLWGFNSVMVCGADDAEGTMLIDFLNGAADAIPSQFDAHSLALSVLNRRNDPPGLGLGTLALVWGQVRRSSEEIEGRNSARRSYEEKPDRITPCRSRYGAERQWPCGGTNETERRCSTGRSGDYLGTGLSGNFSHVCSGPARARHSQHRTRNHHQGGKRIAG